MLNTQVLSHWGSLCPNTCGDNLPPSKEADPLHSTAMDHHQPLTSFLREEASLTIHDLCQRWTTISRSPSCTEREHHGPLTIFHREGAQKDSAGSPLTVHLLVYQPQHPLPHLQPGFSTITGNIAVCQQSCQPFSTIKGNIVVCQQSYQPFSTVKENIVVYHPSCSWVSTVKGNIVVYHPSSWVFYSQGKHCCLPSKL